MSAPLSDKDLFDLYSKYQMEIDADQMEILIDTKTNEPTYIGGDKTKKASLDILEKLKIWYRTATGQDRTLKKEVIKRLDKEFQEVAKDNETLSKKIKEGTPDEELSKQINEKMHKIEQHQAKAPDAKKYTQKWTDITNKSTALSTYTALVAKRSQITNAKSPQEKIKAINNFVEEWTKGGKTLQSDKQLEQKFTEETRALQLENTLGSSKKELNESIKSGLSKLKKDMNDNFEISEPLIKDLKEKVALLDKNDPNKVKYEDKIKEWEKTALATVDDRFYAKRLVDNWNTKKERLERDPVDVAFLDDLINDVTKVYSSPLGQLVKDKIGKEIQETLNSVHSRLTQDIENVVQEQRKNEIEMQHSQERIKQAKELMSKDTIPQSLEQIEEALKTEEEMINTLQSKLNEVSTEDSNEVNKREEVIKSYTQMVNKKRVVSDTKATQEFSTKYNAHQRRLEKLDQEIKAQGLNKDPETVTLEDLLKSYQKTKDTLKEKMREFSTQTEKQTETNVFEDFFSGAEKLVKELSGQVSDKKPTTKILPEEIQRLTEVVDSNDSQAKILTQMIKNRDEADQQIKDMVSLDKARKQRAERLVELKAIKNEAEVRRQGLESVVGGLRKNRDIQNTISLNNRYRTSLASQKVELKNRWKQQTASLNNLEAFQKTL